jgi:hypothetical protein
VWAIAIWVLPGVAAGAAIPMRYPEGLARGFLVLSDTADRALARGEVTQWLERRTVVSRMTFHFDDGSLYDETVRFTQNSVFRVVSYRLVQRGAAFKDESLDFEFDRSGNYKVRYREAPGKDEQRKSGTIEIPDDVSNGMTSVLLKNLPRGASAVTHTMAFTPEPHVLELHLAPDGTDRFSVGRTVDTATRFLVEPKVTGVTGVIATLLGKDPSPVHMWIAQGKAPTFLKFEGALYLGGPTWRIELSSPSWKK